MPATVWLRWKAAVLMRPRSAGRSSMASRAVHMLAASVAGAGGADLGIARTRGEAAVALLRRRGAGLSISAASAAVSHAARPLRRRSALLELHGARRFGEDHALADARGGSRRVVIRKALSGAARDEGARPAPLENEAREVRWTKHARLSDPSRHTRGGPAIERAWAVWGLAPGQPQATRRRQGGDTGRAVEDDVVGMPGELGGLTTQRVARQADDGEQALLALASVLVERNQRRALLVGVERRDALSLPSPLSAETERERRLASAALLIAQGDNHRSPPRV